MLALTDFSKKEIQTPKLPKLFFAMTQKVDRHFSPSQTAKQNYLSDRPKMSLFYVLHGLLGFQASIFGRVVL